MDNQYFIKLEKNLDYISQLQIQNQTAIAELIVNSKKTDAQFARTDAQLAETNAQLARTDAKLEKTDAKLAKIAEMYGGVANNLGAVTEAFFINALKKKPVINGITFDTVFKQLNAQYNGVQDEFDIVLANGVAVFIIEVKYKAHPNDIECLIHKKSRNFATLFPQYNHCKAHLGLATFCINDDLKLDAFSQGVTVLQQQGDIFTTLRLGDPTKAGGWVKGAIISSI